MYDTRAHGCVCSWHGAAHSTTPCVKVMLGRKQVAPGSCEAAPSRLISKEHGRSRVERGGHVGLPYRAGQEGGHSVRSLH